MENESRLDSQPLATEINENDKVVRIENDNSPDSCYFMKYFLNSVMVGVPFTGSPKYDKDKELSGHSVSNVLVLTDGELTMKHDTRKYYVCLVVNTDKVKYFLLTVAQPNDSVEWNNETSELKVIRRNKNIMTLKRDLARDERENNLV